MKKLTKGFTLIELMIVVAIIGILAAIAIPNFVKYQLRSKFSEASSNVEGLRKAQEALRQGERMLAGVATTDYVPGQYWDLGAAPLPAAGLIPGTNKVAWLTTELASANLMDWQVEGATYFNYELSVNCPGVPAGAQSGICYTVGAISDIDGDSTMGAVGLVKLAPDGVAQATDPSNFTTATVAFPGTVGTSACYDLTGVTMYGTPCTITGPDVF
jgi:type IV pilus assembly protein PilA